MELSTFVRALQRSADLVQAWGDAPIPGRPSLRELFAFEDVREWDILAADLALYRIPPALGHGRPARSRWGRQKRQLRALKSAVRHAARRCDDSDCARWPAGPVALFLGFTPYIARDILLPVVAALGAKRGLRPVILTEDSPTPAGADDATFHSVWRHWTSATRRDAQRIGRAARKAFSVLANDGTYRALIADHGRSLWPEAGEAILDLGLYARHEIARFSAVARHVVSHHRPAVMVSPDVADARTRAFTSLGAAAGIPTIEVQFGACGPEATEWRFFAADRAAVWGPQSRDVLVSHHVPAEQVVVTGSPRHDVLFGATAAEIQGFRDRFRVPAGNLAVVMGSTSSANNPDAPVLLAMKRAIFVAAAARPTLTLIVKPHPLEDVNETRALASEAVNIVFADGREDIRTYIAMCDAFVTLGSASTLDAVVLGKPTICPSFPGWRWSELFVNSGAIAVPRTVDEVASAFGELAEDGGVSILARHARARDTFLSEWVQDGGRGGTDRVIALLESAAHHAESRT